MTKDVELTAEDLSTLAGQFKAEYKEKIGADFPDSTQKEQLGPALFRLYSVHGTTRERTYTAATTISRIHGEQLSTYR